MATAPTTAPTIMATPPTTARTRRMHRLVAHLLLPQPTTTVQRPHTILITGITAGLGRALALEFAKLGHTIVGCGRRQGRLDELHHELKRIGCHHVLCQCDVANQDSAKAFANHILHEQNIIPDIVFANAGIAIPPSPLWEVQEQDFKRIFDINVHGVFHILKYFLPDVLAASRVHGATYKRILATSSGLGHSTSPILGAYSATKFSVEALLKSVAQSLTTESNIGAWPFAPGVIQTEMMTNKNCPTASEWAQDAAPYILSLGCNPNSPSGSSVSVPGYYSPDYMATWVLKDGQQLPGAVVAPFVAKKR